MVRINAMEYGVCTGEVQRETFPERRLVEVVVGGVCVGERVRKREIKGGGTRRARYK